MVGGTDAEPAGIHHPDMLLQNTKPVTCDGVTATNVRVISPTHARCVFLPGEGTVPVVAHDNITYLPPAE